MHDFASSGGMTHCVIKLEYRLRLHETSVGSERRQKFSPERRGYRRIVLAGTGQEAFALGIFQVGWRSPTMAHAGGGDGDTAIDFLGEGVTCLALVWFGRQIEG